MAQVAEVESCTELSDTANTAHRVEQQQQVRTRCMAVVHGVGRILSRVPSVRISYWFHNNETQCGPRGEHVPHQPPISLSPLLPFLFPVRPPMMQDVATATKASVFAEGTEDSEPDCYVEVKAKGSELEVRLFVLVVSTVTLAPPTACAVHRYRCVYGRHCCIPGSGTLDQTKIWVRTRCL